MSENVDGVFGVFRVFFLASISLCFYWGFGWGFGLGLSFCRGVFGSWPGGGFGISILLVCSDFSSSFHLYSSLLFEILIFSGFWGWSGWASVFYGAEMGREETGEGEREFLATIHVLYVSCSCAVG